MEKAIKRVRYINILQKKNSLASHKDHFGGCVGFLFILENGVHVNIYTNIFIKIKFFIFENDFKLKKITIFHLR